MKKLLSLILTLVLALVLVGCNEADKNNPSLTNGGETFISLTENNVTYSVTNDEVYSYLKNQYGSSILVELIDEELLTEAGYFGKVDENDIIEAIKADVYGDEELSDEEKAEKEKEFLDDLFVSQGIEADKIDADVVKEEYKLSLARKAYALDQLKAEVKAHNEKYEEWKKLSDEEKEAKLEEYDSLTDEEKAETEAPVTAPYFTDAKVSAKYAKDVFDTYSVVVLPFTTARQAEIALNQVGVEVKDGAWYKDGALLTAIEVVNTFIEIYESLYSFRLEGELNTESEEFKFEASELDTEVLAYVKDNMETYTPDSKNENAKWYTVKPYVLDSGSQYAYILKLSENKVTAFADLTDEEKDAQRAKYEEVLIEEALTNAYVTKAMAKLHNEKELVIYDSVIESAYLSTISSYSIEFEKTEEEHASVVAKYGSKEITADQLFEALVEYQGVAGALDKLAEKRLLLNPEFNKYYDITNEKWLDNDKKAEIEDLIESEKENFENGTYVDYGYDPATMSWELFIKSLYNATNEKELVLAFLIETLDSEYSKGLNYIVNTVDTKTFTMDEETAKASKLWGFIQEEMEKANAKKFSTTGIHLLISHYETVQDYINGSNMVDPKEWDDPVKAAADQLAKKLIEFIKDSKGTYEERLQKIVDAFKAAPQINKAANYNGKEVPLTITSDGGEVTINVSEYKAKGLYVKYENLGTFTEGKMVEAFNNAAKEIWDKDAANDVFNKSELNSMDKVTVWDEPIETTYGVHVYVNLKSNEIDYIKKEQVTSSDETKKYSYTYMPSLSAIRQYTLNSSYAGLNPKEKTAITTFFKPIADELVSEGFTFVMKYTELSNLLNSLDSKSDAVTSAKLAKYVELYKEYAFDELLSVVTPEYIEYIRTAK